MGSSDSAYYVATVSLAFLVLSNLVFGVLTGLDSTGRAVKDAGGTVTGTKLIFGTGTYWVTAMAIPAALLSLFIIGSRAEYSALPRGSSERKMFTYPRYRWDVWTFIFVEVICLSIQIGIFINFMVRFGFNAQISIGAPLTEKQYIYRFDNAFHLISCLLCFFFGIRALYAYAVRPHMYYLIKVKK
jgi:hypothetical protein